MSKKRPQNGQKCSKMYAVCVNQTQNQKRAVSWATCLKSEIRGHLVLPQPPTFCGFQASKSPNQTPTPMYHWSLGSARGQRGPRTVGDQQVHHSPRGEKNFPKLFHLGCSNNCCSPVLSAWWRVLALRKSQKALKMGHFVNQNGSKMGQRCIVPKKILHCLGCSTGIIAPILSPF